VPQHRANRGCVPWRCQDTSPAAPSQTVQFVGLHRSGLADLEVRQQQHGVGLRCVVVRGLEDVVGDLRTLRTTELDSPLGRQEGREE